MQETWTIQRVLNWTVEYFEKHRVPDSRLSAEMLLAHTLNRKRIDLYLQFERILTPEELAQYRAYIQRRVRYEPVQYIIGGQEFMGLNFQVTPAVLIPRPETELLVEKVLDALKERAPEEKRLLDVGTGSGAIAVSVGHFCRECSVLALDNSEAALKIARQNAESLGVDNVEFRQTDILRESPGRFDIVAVNPPYVAETDREAMHAQVKNYEPGEAPFSGRDGLDFYRQFIPLLPALVKPGGLAFMEIGYQQQQAIQQLLTARQINNFSFIADYQNIPRIVKAEL